MNALDTEKWRVISYSPGKSIGVSSILLALVPVGRAAFFFPLSFLSSLAKKSPLEKINLKQQVTIWWAGLMQGAVSMALAYNQFTRSGHTQLCGNAMMITSTITVVLVSTTVFGLITKPLIRILLPSSKYMNATRGSIITSEPSTPKSLTVPLLSNGQDPAADTGGRKYHKTNQFKDAPKHPISNCPPPLEKFDFAFMRPVFGGRGFVPFVPCSLLNKVIFNGTRI